MIAKGKWDSIRILQTNFEFTGGKWQRTITYENKQQLEQEQKQERQKQESEENNGTETEASTNS